MSFRIRKQKQFLFLKHIYFPLGIVIMSVGIILGAWQFFQQIFVPLDAFEKQINQEHLISLIKIPSVDSTKISEKQRSILSAFEEAQKNTKLSDYALPSPFPISEIDIEHTLWIQLTNNQFISGIQTTQIQKAKDTVTSTFPDITFNIVSHDGFEVWSNSKIDQNFAFSDDAFWWSNSPENFEYAFGSNHLGKNKWYREFKKKLPSTLHISMFSMNKNIVQKNEIPWAKWYPLLDQLSTTFPATAFVATPEKDVVRIHSYLFSTIRLKNNPLNSLSFHSFIPKDRLLFIESHGLQNMYQQIRSQVTENHPQTLLILEYWEHQISQFLQTPTEDLAALLSSDFGITIHPQSQGTYAYTTCLSNMSKNNKEGLKNILKTLQGYYAPTILSRELEDGSTLEYFVAQPKESIQLEEKNEKGIAYTTAQETLRQKTQFSWTEYADIFITSSQESGMVEHLQSKVLNVNITSHEDFQKFLPNFDSHTLRGLVNFSQLSQDITPQYQIQNDSQVWKNFLEKNFRNGIFGVKNRKNAVEIEAIFTYR